MSRQATFYNVAEELTPGYWDHGCLLEAVPKDKIRDYILAHPEMQPGDILFLGSTYQTRQEYGFIIVVPASVDARLFLAGEDGPSLPLELKQKMGDALDVLYDNAFQELHEDEDWDLLWFGNEFDSYDQVVELFAEKKLLKEAA